MRNGEVYYGVPSGERQIAELSEHYALMGMSSLNLVQRYMLALERKGRIQRTRLGNIELPS